MSGIYGIINLKGNPVDKEQMDKMETLMIHRGIDGKAQWIDNNVGLGHLKLEITPESEYETLPLRYKQWIITADCRIDNREELDTPLSISEEERSFTPDSTYIVKAYEKWGKNCVQYLIGDFAFAIWDTIEQSLFCARDHIGIKPFFYLKTDDKFIFASELKTIVELGEINIVLNERKILEYIYHIHGLCHQNETYFKDILRVLPSNYLSIENQTIKIKLYWEFKRNKAIKLDNNEAYTEFLKKLLIQAVHCRMRTQKPIGVSLSGGLDSSTVACIAAQNLSQYNETLYAASSVLPINYQGIDRDEREYITSILSLKSNINIAYIEDKKEDKIYTDIDEILSKTMSPINSFYYMDNNIIKKLAIDKNVRVILSGFGGDSGASFNASILIYLLYSFKFIELYSLFKKRLTVPNISFKKILYNDFFQPIKKLFESCFYLFNEDPIDKFTNEKLVKKYNIKNYKKYHLIDVNFHKSIAKEFTAQSFYLEEINITHSLHHTEAAIPLLDIRIIDYIMNIPLSKIQFNGWKRGLLRFAMKGILPDKIAFRTTKSPFVPAFKVKIIHNKTYIINTLLSKIHNNPYINTQQVKAFLDKTDSVTQPWFNNYNLNFIYLTKPLIVALFTNRVKIFENEKKNMVHTSSEKRA